jgi:hypothetical protein
MGSLVLFPRHRIVRRLDARAPRTEELECRILELMRVLRRDNNQDVLDEILRLRDQIWRLDAGEEQPSSPVAWPRGH